MANMSICKDTSEAVELCEAYGLYLKPVAKINICTQLPQLKTPGKTICNWEVMEKVKQMIRPETFLSVKVVKSTMEFVRLEGEIENKSKLSLLTMKLDGKTIKLSGFPETLKVRAAESKLAFPVRHDWDSYFRDARNMNELRPGERPDTIHFQDLPTRWFARRSERDSQASGSKLRPSEEVLCTVFETFGEVRCVDIPMLDPHRKEIMGLLAKPGTIQTFNYGQDIQFEAYVQFKEYISFMKAMDALKGMKLMYKEDEDKAHSASIKVDFDKTKHLSDKMIRKRQAERDRLEDLERLRKEEARRQKEEEERKREDERLRLLEAEKEKVRKKEEKERLKEQRRKERQERRRQKQIAKKQREEAERIRLKIAIEERRLLVAQRKLESLRLLSELFEHVKVDKLKENLAAQEEELEEQRRQEALAEHRRRLEQEHVKAEASLQKKLQSRQREQELRAKILKKFMVKKQMEEEKMREDLRLKLAGSHRLKSAVIIKGLYPVVHGDTDHKKDHVSSAADDKETGQNESDDDDVQITEMENKNENISVIDILSSDDGDGDEKSGSKNQKSNSMMDRVLQGNRLRAWDVASPQKRSFHKEDFQHKSKRKGSSPVRRSSKQQKRTGKHVRTKEADEDSNSDSADSTTCVIPPPRSSFAPPDSRSDFVHPHTSVSHPRRPYRSNDMSRRPHQTSRVTSPLWRRSRNSVAYSWRDKGRDRNFHAFKAPYLKKYNSAHHNNFRSDRSGSRSRSSFSTHSSSQNLTRKKDTDRHNTLPSSTHDGQVPR